MQINADLTDVMVERSFDLPFNENDHCRELEKCMTCMNIYGIQFIESFLSFEKDRMICHFRAPDAESVRQAIRKQGLCADLVWSCQHELGSAHGKL